MIYVATALWSLRLSAIAPQASLIWAPSGLALAAMIIFGQRVWPAMLIGATVANGLYTDWQFVPSSIAIGVGNTLETVLAWWLLRRVLGFDPRMRRIADGVAIVFVAAPLATLPAALIGALATSNPFTTSWAQFGTTMSVWYAGDAVSILLLTPLLVMWAADPTIVRHRIAETGAVTVVLALTTLVAFGRKTMPGSEQHPLTFLPMPALIWGAMRLGPRNTASLSFLMCLIAGWATVTGRGPFDMRTVPQGISILWAFIAAFSGTALCLSTASEEKRDLVATLSESRERFRLLVEGTGLIAWEFDVSLNRFTFVSARARSLLGYPLDAWYAPGFWAGTLHADDRENALKFRAQCAGNGVDHELEYRMVAADGRTVWIHDITTVARSQGTTRLRGAMIDVTERKAAEEEMAMAERKFRILFEQSPYGVWIADHATGTIIEANDAMAEMLGYTPAELRGKPIFEVKAERSRERVAARIEKILREGNDVFETRMRRKDGTEFDALAGTRVASIGNRTVINAIIRDITEQRRAMDSVRASEERFRAMFEGHDSIMLLLDQGTGQIVDANAAASRFYGYSNERLRTMRIAELVSEPGSDPGVAIAGAAPGSRRFECGHRLADGRVRHVEIHTSALDYAGHTLQFTIVHDATDRKLAEEERDRLQARVLHAQKLESLGVMAGGIAHDFNNLLVGILGNAGLAINAAGEKSELRPVLKTIEQAAQRAADLTRQLLAYAGKGRLSTEPLSLSDLVLEMAQLLDVSISRTANVDFQLQPDLPLIRGDATQVRQVLMNLLTNAADALEGRPGSVVVRAGVMNATTDYLKNTYVSSEEPEGRYVYLEIADSGKGMDGPTMQRMFDPFFTTKFTGRGLGLAAVLGIMRGHRGAIKVSSQPGNGTTVRILFPIAQNAVAATAAAPATPARGDHTRHKDDRRILVVDDEQVVRDMACAALARAGFATLKAIDGEAAIQTLCAMRNQVGAILLDMTMPGLSGPAVIQRMRELGMDIPVILTSGYAEQEVVENLKETPHAGFLQKPYLPDALVEAIERACGENPNHQG
ncbi:MAG: PAS domain S-box protein [Planctomycetes bacterium]|nr:PAS domain S-box protein [Planctomycetota bacterium]